jgi:hypothetical protein
MESCENTHASHQINNPRQRPRCEWWRRLVGYIKGKTNERRTKRQQETSADKAARKTATATVWIAFFSFALAGAAIYQFFILNSQLDVLRKDQRAWINVMVSKSKLAVGDERLHVTSVTITNTGKTPAMNVVGHLLVEVVSNGSQPHFTGGIPHVGYIAGALIPNDPQESEIRRLRFKSGHSGEVEESPLTPEERLALSDGRAWLATYGRIEYDDVFKKSHWTQFCGWGQFNPSVQYSSQECTEYNNVDGK